MRLVSWLAFAFFVVVTPLSAQINYYINDLTGSDVAGYGLNPDTPFKTLAKGVDALTAGDTLNVMEGIYYNDKYGDGDVWKKEKTLFVQNKNGSENENIVIRPYLNDHVVLRGDGIYIVQIRNSSFITLEGFEVEGEVNNISLEEALAYQFAYRLDGSDEILYRVPPGTPPAEVANMTFDALVNYDRPAYFDTKGILVHSSHQISIVNNHIHHTPGTGLRFKDSSYFSAIGNEINDCSRRSYSGTHALVLENCQDVNNSPETKIWLQRNHVHHNYNEIYSWSPTKTFINPVIDEGKGISLQRNGADTGWMFGRIQVENNLTHHNGFSGLHSNTGRGIDFVNNTSYYDSFSGNGNNHGISLQATQDVNIINNIVVHDTSLGGHGIAASSSSSDYIVSNNLVYGEVNEGIEAVAENTIFADPLFFDSENLDFRLLIGSPAIGAALASFAPSVDFNDMPRNELPDLGALEYSPISKVNELEAALEVSIYPNPFNEYITIDSSTPLSFPIFLFDALGKEVKRINDIHGDEYQISIYSADLSTGIYYLKVGRIGYVLCKS